jgi:hypothetical protein
MTPRKHLILLKKSGAFAFQLVSLPTTKSRHFGGDIDGSRGGKTSKFLHLEVAESRREKTHETEQLHPVPDPDQQRQAQRQALQTHRWWWVSFPGARADRHAAQGRGKSGGRGRAINYWIKDRHQIYMLVVYLKAKKDDLSDKETAILRELVKEL